MTDIIFSKSNVTDFSTSIKNLFNNRKFKKVKSFIINLPIEYREIVTKLSENTISQGFKGNTQFKVNSITSRYTTDDNKYKITLMVTPKFKTPDIIAVR